MVNICFKIDKRWLLQHSDRLDFGKRWAKWGRNQGVKHKNFDLRNLKTLAARMPYVSNHYTIETLK